MRRRANRAAIFAAVVGAHLLLLHFLPDFRVPPEVRDRELSLPITIYPTARPPQPRSAISRPPSPPARERELAAARSRRAKRAPNEGRREIENPAAPSSPPMNRPWIDWEQEGEVALAHRRELAAQAARRAAALSRWREHVMPGPAPRKPEFRWDEARTSQRFVPSIAGLVVHLNDRCLIIISPLALLGGCAIGHIPVHGDLFAHMDDPKEPIGSTLP